MLREAGPGMLCDFVGSFDHEDPDTLSSGAISSLCSEESSCSGSCLIRGMLISREKPVFGEKLVYPMQTCHGRRGTVHGGADR